MEFTVKDLWDILGDIPINEDDEIELQFLHFKVGTRRENIWHWFEDTFDLSVAKLMYGDAHGK